jgi:PPOX class probable F420-dependent enzyme
MSPDEAREFVASNHRAVLITRRRGGGLQTSPVLVGVDDEGKVVISTREGAYKTCNLRRDPTVVLCVLSDSFFGRWIQIEGWRRSCRCRRRWRDWSTTTGASAGSIPTGMTTAAPWSNSSACWFASRSTRWAPPAPASPS